MRDRSILLTGAGSGIGRSQVLQLAHHTPRLTLVGRRPEPLEEIAPGTGSGRAGPRRSGRRGGHGRRHGRRQPDRGTRRRERAQMIDLNRNDPAAVDQFLAGRKPELEQAVAGHSIL